ncbi:hypothetical protein ACJIZ3_012759 [Penstemon smallii]|uniref:Uncharacterized protein n=1 Tax=Penstemon smallii TaxID=265156 RepID=A0ABD3UN01_9LAMI
MTPEIFGFWGVLENYLNGKLYNEGRGEVLAGSLNLDVIWELDGDPTWREMPLICGSGNRFRHVALASRAERESRVYLK